MATETIAAIATPLGNGGIGVIRISGSGSEPIASELTGRPEDLPFKPRYAHLVQILDEDGMALDEALVVYMPSPESYTGEDVVEVSCHGSPIVLRQVLDRILAMGARPALAGEFTLRAFLNGRIDLAQAEAVADLVAAPTPEGVAVAAHQLAGRLSDAVRDMRIACVDLLAQMEAEIDFDEEDVPAMNRETVSTILDKLEKRLTTILESANRGIMQRHDIRVALVGCPNVGKSSLMNALLNTDRAIVTDVPGTTRDVLEESFNLNGVPIVLNDTAGIREARDPVEDIGVSRTSRTIEQTDLIVLVLDASRPLLQNDLKVVAQIHATNKPLIVALNKRDLPQAIRSRDIEELLPDASAVLTAAIVGDIDELRQALERTAGIAGEDGGLSLVASVRHENALRRTRQALISARAAVADNEPSDLITIGLRGAVNALGEITGESATEELLDTIFSKFCIGK